MHLTSNAIAKDLARRSQESKTLRPDAGSGDKFTGTGRDDNVRLLPEAATKMIDNPALAIRYHRPAIAREGYHRRLHR